MGCIEISIFLFYLQYPKHCEDYNNTHLDLFTNLKDAHDITSSYLSKYEVAIKKVDPVKHYDIPTDFTICDICSEERNFGVIEVSDDESIQETE